MHLTAAGQPVLSLTMSVSLAVDTRWNQTVLRKPVVTTEPSHLDKPASAARHIACMYGAPGQ